MYKCNSNILTLKYKFGVIDTIIYDAELINYKKELRDNSDICVSCDIISKNLLECINKVSDTTKDLPISTEFEIPYNNISYHFNVYANCNDVWKITRKYDKYMDISVSTDKNKARIKIKK